jgi:hypothetical protein
VCAGERRGAARGEGSVLSVPYHIVVSLYPAPRVSRKVVVFRFQIEFPLPTSPETGSGITIGTCQEFGEFCGARRRKEHPMRTVAVAKKNILKHTNRNCSNRSTHQSSDYPTLRTLVRCGFCCPLLPTKQATSSFQQSIVVDC